MTRALLLALMLLPGIAMAEEPFTDQDIHSDVQGFQCFDDGTYTITGYGYFDRNPCPQPRIKLAEEPLPVPPILPTQVQMKDIIGAIIQAASGLDGGRTPIGDPSLKPFTDMQKAITSQYGVAIGYCARIPDHADGDIVFGAFTTAPEGVPGFVNIGNTWCGLRSTGERVRCPPPVPNPC